MHFQEMVPLAAVVFGMTIPLVAIVGGIAAGIIKSNSRHRLLELAQRERIAALERGIDPERLPKLELPPGLAGSNGLTFEQRQQRRAEGLRIWGYITFGFGIMMFVGISLAQGIHEGGPALMFAGVGGGMILGARLVKTSPDVLHRDSPIQPE
jgi:hypothetical protein